MLMAQLSHEASSSLRAHQQQESEVAAAAARAAQTSQDSGAPAPSAASVSSAAADAKAGAVAAFAPRLTEVERSNGPLRQLGQRAPRALLVDVDVGALLADIAAVSAAPPPPPPPLASSGRPHTAAHHHPQQQPPCTSAQGAPAGEEPGGSLHGASLYTSPAGGGLYAGGVGSPNSSYDLAGDAHAHRGGHAGGSAAAAAAAARAHWEVQVGRVRGAATALALLHRWGLDADADAKLAALLRALGLLGTGSGCASGCDGWWAAAAAGHSAGGAVSAPLSRAGSFPLPPLPVRDGICGSGGAHTSAAASELERRLSDAAAVVAAAAPCSPRRHAWGTRAR
jgi:hypothetical protein